MSWDIIIWNNENKCDFVPSSWVHPLKATEYKCPVGPRMTDTKKKRLVYDCQDITEEFDYYPAICKRANVTSLERAKHFTTQLTYTSNLESDAGSESETERPSKKKKLIVKKKKEHVVQSDTWKRPQITAISGLSQSNSTARQSSSTAEQYDEEYYMRIADGIAGSETSESVEMGKSYTLGSGTRSSLTPLINTETGNLSVMCSNNNKIVASTAGLTSTDPFLYNEIIDISRSTPRATTGSAVQLIENGDNQPLLDTLNGAVFEIKQMKKQIGNLEIICSSILNKLNGSSGENHSVQSDILQVLPLNTIEEVGNFEALLNDPVNTKTLEEILYLVGGDNYHRSVFLQMGKLLSKELALQYSGVGKKKKLPFCSLKMYKTILCACRKRYSATEAEIKKSVSIFLASAKGRLVRGEEREDEQMDADKE